MAIARPLLASGHPHMGRLTACPHCNQPGFAPSQPVRRAGVMWAMKFSGDGRYLASAGQDTLVCVWQLLPARGGPPEASAADANGSDAPGAPWFRPQGQTSAWHQARPVCVGAADEPACCEVQVQAAFVFQPSPESVSADASWTHLLDVLAPSSLWPGHNAPWSQCCLWRG